MNHASIVKLYEVTAGKAWEPPQPQHPKVLELIAAGYVKRVDGRWGYERFKESMLAWTDAGRAAVIANIPTSGGKNAG